MKINLDGIYRDIKPLIESPLKPDVKAPAEHKFTEILASLFYRDDKSSHNSNGLGLQELTEKVVSEDNDKKMASLRPSDRQLKSPEPELIPMAPEGGATAGAGVKTPSLLEARRLKHDTSFSVLTRPDRMQKAREFADQAAKQHGIDPALSMSIIENESSFDSNAVSRDGHASKGLMQLLDSTGSDFMKRSGNKEQYNPFNPEQNVNLGVSYLRYLHEIFNEPTALPNELKTQAAANYSSLEKLAVASFNAGEGRVASAQARAKRAGMNPSVYEQIEAYLPESTQEYVKKVMASKASYEGKI